MFYMQLEQLCDKKGLSISTFVSDKLHMSKGNITRWKNGAVPNSTTVQKIADYFGVTTDYLLNGTIVTGSVVYGRSPAEAEDEVPEEFLVMARKAGDIPPEQRKRLYKFLDSTIDNFLEALKDEQSDK